MLRHCLVIACISISVSVQAQGRRGLDDNGNCVAPCSRAGGMPCRPCLPRTGPGSEQWLSEVEQFARGTDAFRLSVSRRAYADPTYRVSAQYEKDRTAAAELVRTTEALNALTRYSAPQE